MPWLSAIRTAEDLEGLTGIPEKLPRCPRSSFSPLTQHRSNSLSLSLLPLKPVGALPVLKSAEASVHGLKNRIPGSVESIRGRFQATAAIQPLIRKNT